MSKWPALFLVIIYFFLWTMTIGLAALLGPAVKEIAALQMLLATFFIWGITTWWLHRIEGKRPVGLGLVCNQYSLHQLLSGFITGMSLMLFVFGAEYLTGGLRYQGCNFNLASVGYLGLNLCNGLIALFLVAINEELGFRGYMLQKLSGRYSFWFAALVSSVLFGTIHLLNFAPGTSVLAIVNITLAGFLFALAYRQTKALWLPIGIHWGWNYLQGYIIAFPGYVTPAPFTGLLKVSYPSASVWNGGSFGPEGGLWATLVLIACCLWLLRAHNPDSL